MPASHTSASTRPVYGARVITLAHAGAAQGKARLSPYARRTLVHFHFGGSFRVAGTVKRKGTPSNIPTRARVRLFRDRDGLFVAEAWSDAATGAYSFDFVSGAYTYTAVAYDPTLVNRATVGDRLTPVAM